MVGTVRHFIYKYPKLATGYRFLRLNCARMKFMTRRHCSPRDLKQYRAASSPHPNPRSRIVRRRILFAAGVCGGHHYPGDPYRRGADTQPGVLPQVQSDVVCVEGFVSMLGNEANARGDPNDPLFTK